MNSDPKSNQSPAADDATTTPAAAPLPPVALIQPPPPANVFTLSLENASTAGGANYFMVYPPALVLSPTQIQTTYPQVSEPTTAGTPTSTTTMTWTIPPDGLLFVTQAPGQAFANADQWPVALGQQVTVSWTDGQLEAVCGTGSVPGVIAVTFQPGIPPGAAVGLLAGPGGCVFSVPPNVSTVTMALATQPSLCIYFGTPPGSGGFSDLSAPLVLNPAGVSAAVCIGADNILHQTG